MESEKTKKTIGFFPMCADLLHAGHVIALEEAKNKCDYLIVGLNCNPAGKNPYQSIYERFMQLRAVKYVDEIIPYDGEKDMESIVKSLNYDVRFLGSDYCGKRWDGKEHETATPYFVSRKHKFSTSELAQRVKEDKRSK